MIPAEAAEAARDALWTAPAGSASITDLPDETVRIILEAAVPHMLRRVHTVEQLDTLPIGSVVLGYDDDLDQLVSRKSVDGYWQEAGTDDGWQAAGIIQWYGSVTVLHEPTP